METAEVIFADVVQDVRESEVLHHKLEHKTDSQVTNTLHRGGGLEEDSRWKSKKTPQTLNLVYRVRARPLLFQPISEQLVGLMICWCVMDGGRWKV